MGNKHLGTPSLPVSDFASDDLKQILLEMKNTMEEKKGVGIAAPQIGYPYRIIMLGFDKNERYPNEKPVPFSIIINPQYEALSDEMIDGWEGCLSIPGLRGFVPRYKKIKYSGYDPNGHTISDIVEGFHARIIQHECDHINGILFPERLNNLKCFGFEDELKEAIWPRKI